MSCAVINKEPVVLSWSGGKDSAMVAYHLLASQKYEIAALLTTVTEDFDRISMHGVRLADLPRSADPCGEHGEYHSFVYAGPIFKKTIDCKTGETTMRSSRFNYCDILATAPK